MKKVSLIIISIILSISFFGGCSRNDNSSGSSFFPSERSEEISVPVSEEESGEDPEKTSSEASEEVSSEPSEEESEDVSESEDSGQSSEPSAEISGDVSGEESKLPYEDYISEIYDIKNKYFVRRLSENELNVFAAMYHAALNFENQVDFGTTLPEDDLDRLMWYINYDCPELIHLKGDYSPRSSAEISGHVSGVGLYFNMQQDEYSECMSNLGAYFEKLRKETENMDEFEKEKYVFDKIFSECVFDDYAEKAGSAYGALIEHRGRCEGISKAFSWCMHEIGIECLTVAGEPLWENDGAYPSHSWNIVKILGNYYHTDIAADNLKLSEDSFAVPLYGFFNMDDEMMSRSRRVNSFFAYYELPVCDTLELNYHIMNGLYVAADEDPELRLKEILAKKYIPGEENTISIRFETKEAYDDFVMNGCDRFEEFEAETGNFSGSDTIYYNNVQNTAALYITP